MKKKILLVEDDRPLAQVLSYNFTQAGYDIDVAPDGEAAVDAVMRKDYDVIVLDVMLPRADGIEVCKHLRARPQTRDVFIIMLTAKNEEVDQLIGFKVGADDYMTKPFSVKILLARVKALLQSAERGEKNDGVVALHGVTVDRRAHTVLLGDKVIQPTLSEFRILDTLIRQPGRKFDRMELLDVIGGEENMIEERTIDVHIRNLRRRMEPDYDCLIETVRGEGYRFRFAEDPKPTD